MRGWIIAIVCTCLGVAAHSLAGGEIPSPLLWALCTALTALICVPLSGRRLPKTALALAVAASQGLLHFLFAHSGGMAIIPENKLHHHGLATATQTAMSSTMNMAHHGNMVQMFILHGCSALVTYWILLKGEQCAVQCLEHLQIAISRLVSLPKLSTEIIEIPSLPVFFTRTIICEKFLLSLRPLRGPPLRSYL